MANAVIGALRVNLGLDAAQFQRGAAAANASAQTLANRIRAIGIAAGAAVAGLALVVRGQLNAADQMAKTADRIGLSVEALSRLEHAASLSGVSMGTFEGAMQRLARTAVESASDLHALGIATRDSAGRMRPMEAILMDVADRLARMPPGAERTALAVKLLGRSGADLIPMLQGGSAGLRAMMAEADALGLTLSTKTARAAEQFNDNLSRLRRQFTGIARMMMAELAPALAAISNGIVAAVGFFRDLSSAVGGFQGYIVAAAGVVAGAYVPAIWGAITATATWAAGLVTLRGVLIATGIGALIVGAGTLVNMMLRLVETTGGWGNALVLLGEVAAGVWDGITIGAQAIVPGLNAVWLQMKAGFMDAIADMADYFNRFISLFAGLDGLPDLPGPLAVFARLGRGARALETNRDDLRSAAIGAMTRAEEQRRRAADILREGTDQAAAAIGRLRDAVTGAGDAITEIIPPTVAATDAVDALGGGAGRAAEKVREVEEASRKWADEMAGHFDGLITGGKGLEGVLSSIARQLESQGWRQLFGALSGSFGGGGGGIFGSIFRLFAPASFDGGGYTGGGARMGGLDGKGGFLAMLHPRETVIDHTRGQGAGRLDIYVHPSGEFDTRVRGVAAQVYVAREPGTVARATEATHASFAEFRPA